VGKLSFDAAKLTENAQAFVDHIMKMKPQSLKGVYVKKICLTATMSPSVLVDLSIAS